MPAQQADQAPAITGALSTFSAQHFTQACRDLGQRSGAEAVVLTRGDEMLACDLAGDSRKSESIAALIKSTWISGAGPVLIQFSALGENDASFLLFTKAAASYQLTLAARPETSLSALHAEADGLIAWLFASGSGAAKRELPAGRNGGPENRPRAGAKGSYAIVWRPVEPMPRTLRQAVRESAQRLAREKGCHLRFVGVASDHVHLVLDCPPHRRSAWVAYAFKSGIQEDIQSRYGTRATLWRRGFLANSSAEPLAGDELLFYLNGAV